MAEKTEKAAEKKADKDKEEFGPNPGSEEFKEKAEKGEAIHGPDPTGTSPTITQQEEASGNGEKQK